MSSIVPSSQSKARALIPLWLTGPWGMIGFVSILYALVLIAWTQFHWGREENAGLTQSLATVLPMVFHVLVTWRIAFQKQFDLRLRKAWFLFGLASLFSFLGDLTWIYLEDVLQVEPFPSFADVFYLGSYSVMLWGLFTMPGAPLSRHERIKFWLNILVMLTTASMFVGYFVIIPTASVYNASLVSRLLATVYPVCSLMILGAVLSILLRLPEADSQAVLLLLLAGAGFFLASDLAFAYTSLAGTYTSGNWIDSGWHIAQAFMVLAALRQMDQNGVLSRKPWWISFLRSSLSVLPLLTALLGYGLVFYVAVMDFSETVEWLFIASAFLTLFIIARQIFMASFSGRSLHTKLILTFLLVCISSIELVSIFTYFALRAHPNSAWQVFFISSFTVFILAACAAVFLAQRFVAPILRLTTVARQIAAGDLTAKAQVESQDEIGALAGTFNTMLDALSQTQSELRRAEVFANSIFSSLRAHVAVLDRHGQIISVNKAWESFVCSNGAPDLHGTCVGVNYLQALEHTADDPEVASVKRGLKEVLNGARAELVVEYPCHSPTEKRWFLMHATPLISDQGGAVVSHTNITELKLAQQSLQESEERYRRLVDYSPDMIAVHDRGKFIFINPAGVTLLGARSTDEIIGQPVMNIVPAKDKEIARKEMEQSLTNRQPTPLLRQTVQRMDGGSFEAEFRAIPILYEGEPAIQVVMRDITKRKQLEEQWQKFKQGIERSSEAVFMTDVDGTISYINPAFETLYGYTWDEVAGQTPRILKSGLTAPETYQRYWEMLSARSTVVVEIINRTKDGRLLDIEGSHNPILDEAGRLVGFLAVHRDVTERKHTEKKIQQLLEDLERKKEELEIRVEQRTAELSSLNERLQEELAERQRSEEALRRSEEKYRNIFENVQDVFYTTDFQGTLTTISPSIEKYTGYRPEEIVGGQVQTFFMNEADYQKLDLAISTQGILNDYEIAMKRKDGSLIHVSVTARVVCNENGQPISTNGVMRDITERKHAEEELSKAKDTAEAASRAKSEFLSRMSHELRTPMNAILGFAQLLEMSNKEPLSSTQHERVKQIVKGGQHLLELINEILDISRIEANRLHISPEPVSVRESVQEVLDLTVPLAIQRHIQVVIKPGGMEANPFVKADRQRFKQVLLNLLGNAVKYNYDGGSVIISCEPTPANRIRISIADAGPGIPHEQLGRLFKPFERLVSDQSNIEGTGLGLTLAKRLVELMNGQIGVDSTPGKGSTFWIELPAAESPVERLQRADGTRELSMLSGTAHKILYVEDNVANFELIRQVLGDYSQIELLWASDARAGFEMALEHQPSLVLLDVHLGGSDGAELLQKLKRDENMASIPVVVVSADATSGQARRLTSMGAHTFMTKPLDVKRFVQLMEELLAERQI